MHRLTFYALLEAQSGAFTFTQARDHGVTAAFIRAQVAARGWRHVTRNVYLSFTGPLHDHHRRWIAVLAAGPGACLSHETAAHLHALIAQPPRVHVLVGYANSPDPSRGTVVHRTRSTRNVVGSPPLTSVADTLCDLSASGWSSRRLAGPVTTAIQRRLTDAADILGAMSRRAPFPGIAGLRDLARDTGAGAESVLELRFLRDVERAHRLPRGERQSRATRGNGRVTYRDVHYPAFGITVELDGMAHHGSLEARLRDARRDVLAAADGEATLRYGWLDIAEYACLAARELATLMTSRGWTGQPQPCDHCAL